MNIGVIFAGGVGSRMHRNDRPKQFLELYNKPVIIHTLEHFENHDEIDGIVIACVEDWIEHLEKLIIQFKIKKVKKIVPGGRTGQLSIYNGLKAAKEVAGNERCIVLIHDGVRPLINSELLSSNIESVKTYGSAITGGVVTETIVVVNEDLDIELVPSRVHSRVAKAPQSFWLDEILNIHEKALASGLENCIDSCTLMKQYGKNLHMIDGPYENIKITTPDDFNYVKTILESREKSKCELG